MSLAASAPPRAKFDSALAIYWLLLISSIFAIPALPAYLAARERAGAAEPLAASHYRFQVKIFRVWFSSFSSGASLAALLCVLSLFFPATTLPQVGLAGAGVFFALAALWLVLSTLFGAACLLSGRPIGRLKAG